MNRTFRNTMPAVPDKISRGALGALIGTLLVSASAGATAQEQDWELTLSPYIWAAGLSGITTLGPVEGDVDVGFIDLLETLDIGAMLDARLEKGRWALQSNLIWADLGTESSQRLTQVKVNAAQWIVELDGHYQVTDNLELLAGIRYYDIRLDVEVTGAITASPKGDKNWIDPLVGGVFSVPITGRWSFKTRGDIGGFGAGSDLSWQLWGLFDYRFGKRNSLAFGWRHLAWDYSEGRFGMDTYMTGPVVGARFRF